MMGRSDAPLLIQDQFADAFKVAPPPQPPRANNGNLIDSQEQTEIRLAATHMTTSTQTTRTARLAADFVRAHWRLLIVCVVVFLAGAAGLVETQSDEYTATLTLTFSNSAVSQTLAGLNPVGSSDPQSTIDTNVALVTLGEVPQATARALGHGLTPSSVKRAITVAAVGDTSLVSLNATAASPREAAALANTYGKIFVAQQNASSVAGVDAALRVVDRQIANLNGQSQSNQLATLQARAQSLEVLAASESQSVQVAQFATQPTSPSSPRTKRDLGLAVIAGLLIGILIGVLRDQLSGVITSVAEVELVYGRPVITAVPNDARVALSPRTGTHGEPAVTPEHADVFGMVRAYLQFVYVEAAPRVLVVVSGTPGDGKSLVASNLAAAATAAGERILLLEGDLRRPSLARRIGVAGREGLVDVILGRASLESVIETITVLSPASNGTSAFSGDSPTFDFLPAGAPPSDPSRLIESSEFSTLLDRLRADYDLIIVDTAPLGVVPDAMTIVGEADGVIAVSRLGKDRPQIARRLAETITSTGTLFVGVVANCVSRHETPYGEYGYYTGTDPGRRSVPKLGKRSRS